MNENIMIFPVELIDQLPDADRKYRDRIFGLLFGSDEYKSNALSLYNALTGSQNTDINDLTIYTLDGVIYMEMENDTGILIGDSVLHLWEQMSTVNSNMPLRALLYAALSLHKYVKETKQDIYGSKPVHIPAPKCFEFYNGKESRETEKLLKLSDLMPENADTDIELVLHMYNINPDAGCELLLKSRPLYEYSHFVKDTSDLCDRIKAETGLPHNKALTIALDQILMDMDNTVSIKEVLMKHRNEAYMSLLYEYDSELHDETLRKEGIEQGLQQGKEEGRVEGLQQGKEEGLQQGREEERAGNIRTLYSSLRASMSKENAVRWISDNLRVPLDEVSEILEITDES